LREGNKNCPGVHETLSFALCFSSVFAHTAKDFSASGKREEKPSTGPQEPCAVLVEAERREQQASNVAGGRHVCLRLGLRLLGPQIQKLSQTETEFLLKGFLLSCKPTQKAAAVLCLVPCEVKQTRETNTRRRQQKEQQGSGFSMNIYYPLLPNAKRATPTHASFFFVASFEAVVRSLTFTLFASLRFGDEKKTARQKGKRKYRRKENWRRKKKRLRTCASSLAVI